MSARFLAGLDAPQFLARHVRREPRAGFVVRHPKPRSPCHLEHRRTRSHLFRRCVIVRNREA
jgi:hypothetical protein